jgi:hypothetical protein
MTTMGNSTLAVRPAARVRPGGDQHVRGGDVAAFCADAFHRSARNLDPRLADAEHDPGRLRGPGITVNERI